MPQTIVTKYHGPTNSRGARVSAKCDAGRITLDWDHALNPERNHVAAATTLIKKLGWDDRTWAYGSGQKDRGETFVPVLSYNVIKASGKRRE